MTTEHIANGSALRTSWPDAQLPTRCYRDEPQAARSSSRRAESTSSTPSMKTAVEPFEIQRLDQIHIATRRAIVQGLGLDEGAVAAIVGAPNAGKTAFAVSLATAASNGAERWLDRKIAGGPVVYFAAEARASVIMRAHAAATHADFPRRRDMYITGAVPQIGGETTADVDVERLIATISAVSAAEKEQVCLVFIDTLASCLGSGDENGAGMLRLVACAKHIATRTSACVVLLHHPSKGDNANLRGHGSLTAACDSIIRIDAAPSGVRTATLVKARDHSTRLQLRFELDSVTLPERDTFGDPLTTVVVRASRQAAQRPYPPGQRQRQLLAELERQYLAGEQSWDDATALKAGRALGMHRNSSRDALRGLQKAGYLLGPPDQLILKFPPETAPTSPDDDAGA